MASHELEVIPAHMHIPLALRSLRHDRGVAATVVLTMSLGVGAFTTAFGIVDAALFRSPPFPGADRLALLYTTHASASEPLHNERWSFPRIRHFRERATTVEHVANFSPTALSLTGTDLTEPVRGEIVSVEYFSALGVTPRLGRLFDRGEDGVGVASDVVLLGHDLWQRRYAADPGIVGRTIGLNGVVVTVIGVLPPGFRGLSDESQLWVPTALAPRLNYAEYLTTDQNFISLVARRRHGMSLEMVHAELAQLGAAVFRALPMAGVDTTARASATAIPLNEARIVPERRRAVWLFAGGVALLHLLACANATSLLLGRAVARRREVAVRAALGGTRIRLFVHVLVEGATLVLVGGLLGLVIARLASGIVVPLNAWGARNFYGSLADFAAPRFGWRVAAFGLGLMLVTAVLVALAPALGALRSDLVRGLGDGARGATAGSGSLRRPTARGVVVALEAALAVMLLVAGGLMIDSFRRMRGTALGVESRHVLTFWLRPSEVRVPVSAAPAFIERVLASISAVPGVLAASVDGGAPLAGSASSTLRVVGRPEPRPGDAPPVLRHYVGEQHFEALGIPLVRGRVFTAQDRAGQPRVAVISETAARRFWPSGDAIGQRVWFGGGSNFSHPDSSAEIVGIVGDAMYRPLDLEPNRASFYTPYRQFTYSTRAYFVRTAGDPAAAIAAIRDAVHRVDPDLPLTEVRTLDQLIGASWSRQRFDAWFFGGFATLALFLAATGIHAVVSYAVRQRRREMGIRLALGSQPAAVMRLVMVEGMTFPFVGLLAGTAGAAIVGGALRGSLYGVEPADPGILVTTWLVLLGAAGVACAIPGWRAMRVDPHEVLRSE